MAKLLETVLLEATEPTTPGVIPNVKVLGRKSRNRREYTDDAMRGAIHLYEGAIVYTNHGEPGKKHRPMDDRFGRLRNVRFDEQKHELRGDLEHLTTHPSAARLKEDIERKLGYFGLSHDADGLYHMRDGVKVVSQIEKVNSVDLVTNPATAISLLEQEDMPNAAAATDAGPNPQLEALRAGLNAILDKGGDIGSVTAAITEFLDTMKDTGEKKEPEKPAEGAQEQLTATIGKLVEQAVGEALKKAAPKKYVTPAQPQKTNLTEQTEKGGHTVDAPPKDKAALKKWLRR